MITQTPAYKNRLALDIVYLKECIPMLQRYLVEKKAGGVYELDSDLVRSLIMFLESTIKDLEDYQSAIAD